MRVHSIIAHVNTGDSCEFSTLDKTIKEEFIFLVKDMINRQLRQTVCETLEYMDRQKNE